MKRKPVRGPRIRSIALAVAVALLAAACGNGGGTTPETTATPTPTDPAPETTTTASADSGESPGDDVDGLLIWTDEARVDIFIELGQEFETAYGVPVSVEQLGFGDIRDQFKILAPAGEGPDIIIGAHDWLGELAEDALLAEIDLGDKRSLFLDAAVDAFTYDGVLIGMPFLTENIAFFYNPELVPEWPETWDEVRSIAEQLEAAGTVEQGYVLQQADPYHFFPVMTAHGGYVFGFDTQGSYDPDQVGLDSDGSIAAAVWLDEMVADGHLVADTDWEIMHTMFEAGDAAMMISGPWALGRIRDSGIPYVVAQIPAAGEEGRPFLGVHGFMINAFSEQRLLAETFLIEFVATESTMQELFDAIPHTSAYLPLREQLADEDLAAFAAAGTNGLPMPAIPEMSAVWSSWGDAVTLIFQQQVGGEEAFTTAAQQIRDAIAGG